jgi:hypothetical protein
MTRRLRVAWQLTKDGFAEWFRWGDRGAATTAWSGAWAILRGDKTP